MLICSRTGRVLHPGECMRVLTPAGFSEGVYDGASLGGIRVRAGAAAWAWAGFVAAARATAASTVVETVLKVFMVGPHGRLRCRQCGRRVAKHEPGDG